MKTANELKRELKEAGISTKKVSISVSSSCIRCTVKDMNVSVEAIEKVLKKYESVEYCQYSGEILQGGNTFVFVDYDWTLRVQEGEKVKDLVYNMAQDYTTWSVKMVAKELAKMVSFAKSEDGNKAVIRQALEANWRELQAQGMSW